MYAISTAHERKTVLIIYGSTTVQVRLGVLLQTIISVTTLPELIPTAKVQVLVDRPP